MTVAVVSLLLQMTATNALELTKWWQNLSPLDMHLCFIWQGAALYAYNNAQFSENDWIGLKMINDSVKKADAMKVGRFGLGFKSVFHMTGKLLRLCKHPCKYIALEPLILDLFCCAHYQLKDSTANFMQGAQTWCMLTAHKQTPN